MTYSVAIRTLGKAGEKYQKLLESIQNSKRRPEKVVVVLPEGYDLPPQRMGNEEFVFCPKGMIMQRLESLKYISSDCTLFVDDDIEFDEDFVDKLLEPIEKGLFDCTIGPLFSFFPNSTAGKIRGTLTASTSVSFFCRDMYVKILRSGGWSYHKFSTAEKRYYPTENFAGTCFMVRTDMMRRMHMEEEITWVERYGYAYGEDRAISYKLIKNGCRACAVSNAPYIHNDAKTSRAASEIRNTLPAFCKPFMHRVFWQRFLQDPEKSWIRRVQNRICLGYWEVMEALFRLFKWKPSRQPFAAAARNGLKEAKKYVKSEEYRNLPSIYTESLK